MKKIITAALILSSLFVFGQKFEVGDTVEVKESFLKRNHVTKAEFADAVVTEVYKEKVGFTYKVEVSDSDSLSFDETIFTAVIRERNLKPKKK